MNRRSSCPNITSSMSQRRLRAKQIRTKKQASSDALHNLQLNAKNQRIRKLRLQTLQTDSQMRRQYSLEDGKAHCKYCQQWFPEILYEDHIVQHPTHIRQRIWLGNADNAQDIQVIKRCQITHILNCTKEIQIPPSILSSIKSFKRIAIQDRTCETIMNYVTDVCQYIEQCLSTSKAHVLFIHCREGRSRSVSFLCTYLMWKEKMSFHAALSDIRSKRHIVLPNSKFYHELEMFDTQLAFDRVLSPRLKKFGIPQSFVLKKSNGLLPSVNGFCENANGVKCDVSDGKMKNRKSTNEKNGKNKKSTNERNGKNNSTNDRKAKNNKTTNGKKAKNKGTNGKKRKNRECSNSFIVDQDVNNNWSNFESDPWSLLKLSKEQKQSEYNRERCHSLSDVAKVQLKFEKMNFYGGNDGLVMETIVQSPNTEENRVSNQMFEFDQQVINQKSKKQKQKKQKKKKKKKKSLPKNMTLDVSDLYQTSVSGSLGYDDRCSIASVVSIASVGSSMSNYSNSGDLNSKQRRSKSSVVCKRSQRNRKKKKKKKSGELASAIRNMF